MTGDLAWSGQVWYNVYLSLLGLVASENICMSTYSNCSTGIYFFTVFLFYILFHI
jgi:hypothetical protein